MRSPTGTGTPLMCETLLHGSFCGGGTATGSTCGGASGGATDTGATDDGSIKTGVEPGAMTIGDAEVAASSA